LIVFRKPIPSVSAAALARFAGRARRATGLAGQVDILVTGNQEIRQLNRRFRGQDKSTDVLSFPPQPAVAGNGPRMPGGDIVISAQVAGENARRFGHSLSRELKILLLHGMLHLAGYDHESDSGEMARKEARLRRELRLPDSLIARGARNGVDRVDAGDSPALIPAGRTTRASRPRPHGHRPHKRRHA